MKIGVIITAAGRSTRYAQGLEVHRSKLDEDLGGRPVLQRTVEMFTKDDRVGSIVVAAPYEEGAFVEFKARYADKLGLLGVQVCRGGKTHRYETVAAALAAVPPGCTHIAVHDGARPCTPPELIDRLFDAASRQKAVIPALQVTETLKQVVSRSEDASEADPIDRILGVKPRDRALVRFVEKTTDRTDLWLVQTPQVFEGALLRRAYAQTDLASTDDATLVERLGEPVVVIDGDARNIKITRPHDLHLARAILGVGPARERPAHMRF